ncbi:MAG: ATP-binding protein [Rhodobacteraceae bacterium]|nr:ATP-binding protein [Paracoccaceae bacterium]
MGPRGYGKTALLKWVAIEAQKRKLPVVALASDNLSSVAGISRELARQFPPSLLERVHGLIKEIRLNVGDIGGGVAIGDGGKEEKTSELRTWLETLGGVLLIDEAHNMPPEVGHILYNAIQGIGIKHPLMVVIAGTPDLDSVLVRSRATFIEWAPAESIGRLKREDARQALFEPFGKHVNFRDEAVEEVLDDAQDYPYFIQLWGSALWDVLARARTFNPGMDVVNEARDIVNEQRSRLYNRRRQELVNSGLLIPFAEMAWRVGEDGQPSRYDLGLALDHIKPGSSLLGDHPEALQKLLHTGFIWEPKVGTWEYGIPSLASHVRWNTIGMVLEQVQDEGTLPALQALYQCFDRMLKQPLVCKREDLEKALEQHNEGYDPLERFQEMKLLIPTPQPGYVRLMAPHLVKGILAEAERLDLLAEPVADKEEPDWPPRPPPF